MAGFVGLFLAMGLRRPFIWCWPSCMWTLSRRRRSRSLLGGLQLSLVVFLLAVAGWLFLDNKEGTRISFRQGLMAALLFYCFFTTQVAWFPLLPPPSGAGCGNRWYGPSSCLSRCAPGCGWRRPRW
jgi:hypothetical protein